MPKGRPKLALERDGQKLCLRCRQWHSLGEFGFQKSRNRYRAECNRCRSASSAKHYADHIEQYRAKNRANYLRRHEAEIARGRMRYERDKNKYKRYNHDWYLANREHKQASVERWRQKHPDLVKEIMRASVHRRRARKNGAEGSHTQAEWQAVKAKFGFRCLACGCSESERSLTEDHVVPLSKGGSDFIENIQPLCLSCNSSKHDKVVDYRMNHVA